MQNKFLYKKISFSFLLISFIAVSFFSCSSTQKLDSSKNDKWFSLSIMEVSSTVTELHCFSDRIKEVVNTVRNQEIDANRNYTSLSMIAAATFSILSGFVQWQSNIIQAVVSIAGGVSIGTLSYKSINIESQIQYYSVKKNLKDIW